MHTFSSHTHGEPFEATFPSQIIIILIYLLHKASTPCIYRCYNEKSIFFLLCFCLFCFAGSASLTPQKQN